MKSVKPKASGKRARKRTQAERSDAMRTQLLDAARALFVTRGYAETGTPEIVVAAGVTRGALYHHFADKADLFREVCIRDATAVGEAIDAATSNVTDAAQALTVGSMAYFDAMRIPGRAALLLVEAPAVLGLEEAEKLVPGDGRAQQRNGLAQAMPKLGEAEIDATADILSAAFDRTALAIARGGNREAYVSAMLAIVGHLTTG